MEDRPAMRKPGWTRLDVVVWLVAALAPLTSYLLPFAGVGDDQDRFAQAGLAWLIGGVFSLLVGVVGIIRRRNPVRWPDPALMVYGFFFAYMGFSRCALSMFGDHPCW